MVEQSVNYSHSLLCRLFTLAFLILFFSGCSKSTISVKEPAVKKQKNECVVLLHGLARSLQSMSSMQTELSLAGYHTVNLGYPSTSVTIEKAAEDYFPLGIEECQQFFPSQIHFVTHSLGGIVLRKAIKSQRPVNLGNVVMLSPPNKGSKIVDTLKDWRLYRWFNGPAGLQLATGPESLVNKLGSVDYPLGIITGDRYAFFDAWFSSIVPGIDDGKVSVESAQIEGMRDFLVVHESHPFIMDAKYVQAETLYFLEHGSFNHQQNPEPPISGTDWFSFPSE